MQRFCMPSLMFLVLLTAGCSREVDPTLRAPPVLGEPLPLTVGVYYGDDLRTHRVTNQPPLEIDFVILTGRAHVSFFDSLFSEIFVNTIPVKSKLRIPEDGEKFDAIIEPKIVSLEYDFIDDGGIDMKVPVVIRYAITLYSSSGEQLSLWTIAGEGHSEGFSIPALDESIEVAMRNAAARFAVAIYKDTAMQRCLERFATGDRAAGQLETCFEKQ